MPRGYRGAIFAARQRFTSIGPLGWGHERKFFFNKKYVLFCPKFCKHADDPTPLGNSSILSMSTQTVVGFCKYSRVFLNLVCGDKWHLYSTPLLVTAPIASMILDQVCSRIRKTLPEIGPEALTLQPLLFWRKKAREPTNLVS